MTKNSITAADEKLFSESFRRVAALVHRNSHAKGFWRANSDVGCKIALIHSELSEALEFHRKSDEAKDDKLPHRRGVEVELADAVIRIMDLAEHLGLDLPGAVIEKHAFNTRRPEMHGKKY